MSGNTWGGRRPGAGRKFLYGERTIPLRVPVSRVAEVRTLLAGANPVQAVVSRWRVLLDEVPGRASQPRWVKVAELLGELEAALKG